MTGGFTEFLIFLDAVTYNTTGLLFVTLGVLLLIRMTGFPDLTVDGSFTIGAALFVLLLVQGWGTPLSMAGAVLGGSFGGLLTWGLNHYLGVGKVVSGVLSMTILILSAPYIASSTMSLYRVESIFTRIDEVDRKLTHAVVGVQPLQMHILFSSLALIAFVLLLSLAIYMLKTRRGVRLRYAGSAVTPIMIPKSERVLLTLVGLFVGNGCVALGGALEAVRRGGYTNNMGIGTVLIAISVLILGEAIIKTIRRRDYLHLHEYTAAAVIGAFVYSAGIQGLLWFNLAFADLRLMTSVFLLVLLGVAGRFYSSSTRLF